MCDPDEGGPCVPWEIAIDDTARPHALLPLPDGRILVAGAQDEDAWFSAYDACGNLEWTYTLDPTAHGFDDESEFVKDIVLLPDGAVAALVNVWGDPSSGADAVLRLSTETPEVSWMHRLDEDHLPTFGGSVQEGYSVRDVQNITTSESGGIFVRARLSNYGPSMLETVWAQLDPSDGSVTQAELFQSTGFASAAFAQEDTNLWVELVSGSGAFAPEAWGRVTVSELDSRTPLGSTDSDSIFPNSVNFVPHSMAPDGDTGFVSFFSGLVRDPVEGDIPQAGVAFITQAGELDAYIPVEDPAAGLSAVVDSTGRIYARWGEDPEDGAPQLIQVEPDRSISLQLPRAAGSPALIDLAVDQDDGVLMLTDGNTLARACL